MKDIITELQRLLENGVLDVLYNKNKQEQLIQELKRLIVPRILSGELEEIRPIIRLYFAFYFKGRKSFVNDNSDDRFYQILLEDASFKYCMDPVQYFYNEWRVGKVMPTYRDQSIPYESRLALGPNQQDTVFKAVMHGSCGVCGSCFWTPEGGIVCACEWSSSRSK